MPPKALGKGAPFGVRKHKIKQNPENTPRSESKHELEDHSLGHFLIRQECEPGDRGREGVRC